MQKITLPGRPTQLPPTSALREYRLADGRPVRIIVELDQSGVDKHGNPVPPGNVLLYAQGYEMTEDGGFVMAPNGYPSRTERTPATLPRSAINDTSRMGPGWVRHVPPPHETISAETMPEGSFVGDALPATGEVGQLACIGGDRFFRWDEGEVERVARAKAIEMENVISASPVLSGLSLE